MKYMRLIPFSIVLTLFGGFAMAFPSMADEPIIVAHRGASKDAPENTIPAFELAWKQNADAIEGDFFLTKDGNIVCTHDKTTKRFSKTNLDVAKSTLEELQKLDVGSYFSPKFRGTKMPTISEVFATIPKGKKIYIEIKCGPEILPALKKALAKSGLETAQIVVISFNSEVIKQFKIQYPDHKAYWLSGFKKRVLGTSPTLKEVLLTLRETKADGFSSSKDGINKAFIDSVKSAGFEYHVWTVDKVAVADKFIGWGAGSITTNVPKVIGEGLLEKAR